jgi:hypothetical protein
MSEAQKKAPVKGGAKKAVKKHVRPTLKKHGKVSTRPPR